MFLRARVRPARGEPFLGGGLSVKNRGIGTSLTVVKTGAGRSDILRFD